MFNSVALNVVIGLVFIYLLYSLLATVLSEIIATILGLRARNLKEAVDRMLNDENEKGMLGRLWDSMRLMKNPDNKVINSFYNNPEIKYLGSSGIFRNPSSFKAGSFSKTALNILFGDGPVTKNKIDLKLQEIIKNANDKEAKESKLDIETANYILSLWEDSCGDVLKFKLQLEGWFDRTMEQATEWYKRKIQIVLLVLGFCLAWLFNADTFSIINKLSIDKDARDKIVSMANAYMQNNNIVVDASEINNSTEIKSYSQKLDSLFEVKRLLDTDIANANTILGTGAWLPDVVKVVTDPKTKEKMYVPQIDAASISSEDQKIVNGNIEFTTCKKWGYFFRLLYHHFWGFIITAVAISLGAPFWFDLLNKLMKLRISQKQETDSSNTTVANTQPVIVKINSNTGEEAVG